MTEKAISVMLSADKILVKKTQTTNRIIEVALKAPKIETQAPRTPVNLALVLDRSGSMGGGKLENAKKAAMHVVDLLQETDHIAVVAYDDSVDVITNSVPASPSNRAEIKAAISRLYTGGSTNLGGGWLTGCQLIASTMQPGEVNRCLLLTDGMANVGMVDPVELAMHTCELNGRGISTSCFGLGLGFNEHLLEGMANQGGGKFYFIEAAHTIPAIFALEFSELSSIVAHGVEIHATLPAGVSASVPLGWRNETQANRLTIFAGDMYSGQELEFYMRLQVPPFSQVENVPIQVEVKAKGGILSASVSAEIVLAYADDEAVDQAPVNMEMMARYAVVDTAEAANEALQMERAGLREEAFNTLNQRVNWNRAYMNDIDANHYQDMSQRMKEGMTEVDRKLSHMREYSDRKRYNR